LDNFRIHAWGWIIPIVVVLSLAWVRISLGRNGELSAFLGSTAYLIAMLGGAAFATYPALLPSVTDHSYDLTIYNAHSGAYSLRVGLIWWGAGLLLAIAYFIFLYSSFRGKVQRTNHGEIE